MDCYSAKQKRRMNLLQQKATYTPGLWNTNTVMLGGLGKDPEQNEDGELDYNYVQVDKELMIIVVSFLDKEEFQQVQVRPGGFIFIN